MVSPRPRPWDSTGSRYGCTLRPRVDSRRYRRLQRCRQCASGVCGRRAALTCGIIGARVRAALANVYTLSNNHVLANSNGASIGDPEYQPGPFDGGTSADQIATLSDFQVISSAAT